MVEEVAQMLRKLVNQIQVPTFASAHKAVRAAAGDDGLRIIGGMLLEGVDVVRYDSLVLDSLVALAVSLSYMKASGHPFASDRVAAE
jgi:hypothetical protein